MKEKIKKAVAAYIAINLLAQFILPTAAYALTSGPSHPEAESFEPVNTNQMVDLFSGDFNYNLPLLTVPGPNGGYPINLAYHAGITMDQEASWVGLGWNINPGVINRNMRGLPDDFSGENVKKRTSLKPNVTLGYAINKLSNPDQELFGFPITSRSNKFQIRYNTYKGLGFSFSRKNNYKFDSKKSTANNRFDYSELTGTVNLDFDSQNGIGVQPSVSYLNIAKNSQSIRADQYNFGLTYHSRNGLSNISLTYNRVRNKIAYSDYSFVRYMRGNRAINKSSAQFNYPSRGGGASFSASSYVPSVINSQSGFTASGYFKNGSGVGGNHFSKAQDFFVSFEAILDEVHDYPAYGYMYSQNRIAAEKDAMMDFNRQQEFAITPDAPTLPVSVMTNDVFAVSGQGIGMVFRPYRSDIGAVYDPHQTSDFGMVSLGNEPSKTNTHAGFNLSVGYTHNYSGKWKDKWTPLETDYVYSGIGSGTSEAFYFKANGEQTADADSYGETNRFGGESPLDFRIGMSLDGTLSWEPELFNKRSHDNNDALSYNRRLERATRSQHIEYRTREMLSSAPDYTDRASYIYGINSYPGQVSGSQIDFANNYNGEVKGSQLGELSVLNPEGNRYVYGLPVYNTKDKSAFFSVDKPNSFNRTIGYDATQASLDNHSGSDHLYSSTETPPYAYCYLLTTIYSADYVDVTGDGPSEDDLGYYVKFNYSKLPDSYKWRSPYYDADYDQGFHSNPMDDKASYNYGEREVYYLNSIETKTHIAEFHISPRKDGRGAFDERNDPQYNQYGEYQYKLDNISLFSKADRNTPVKTAYFKYSYDLCPTVDNNDGSGDNSHNVVGGNTNRGKLTLKEVYFTYQNNTKGSLSPYKFYYREDDPNYNPQYDLLQADCWGNYKPDELVGQADTRNEEFCYVNQNKDQSSNVDRNMSAWNLHQITLPSGGLIAVDYESDDYACVQDKDAMQMCEIVQTGDAGDGDGTGAIMGYDHLEDVYDNIQDRIYFKLPHPVSTTNSDQIKKYIDGIENLYFRAYMKLPKVQDEHGSLYHHDNYDYVEGYCKIDKTKYGVDASITNANNEFTQGYITILPTSFTTINSGGRTVHPFRKASWEYLKMHRPDLIYPSNPMTEENILSFNAFESLSSLFQDFSGMVIGYYNTCLLRGFAKEIKIDEAHPSLIRLNVPYQNKKGGGHRVKKITISDNWETISGNTEDEFTYGQEYIYNDPNSEFGLKSYGVAEYEPLLGKEENPLRLPTDKFSVDRKMILHDNSFYMTYPLCEAYYPGANVGYSKVIVRNLKHLDQEEIDINKKTASGYVVTEFYTAKDFPVKEYPTQIQHKQYHPIGIFIPFIGQQEFDNNGYSQGYTVELNDMHGKLKAQSSFAYNADLSDPDQAIARTEYIYNTVDEYNPNAPNRLLNLVTVLDGDAQTRIAQMGEQIDFFYDLDQHSSVSLSAGAQTNVDDVAIGSFIPSLIPSLSYNYSLFRSVVAMKVINRTGILIETRNRNQGSQAVAKNLMFDSKTGAAILTSVNNDFDKPVYSYSYPAHWSYDGMRSASQNYLVSFSTNGQVVSGGYYQFYNSSSFYGSSMRNYFAIGDKVLVETGSGSEYYWIAGFSANNDQVQLIDEQGNPMAAATVNQITVIKSGRSNQLGVSSGTIVSLSNPVTAREFPLFMALNNLNDLAAGTDYSFTDCLTGEQKTFRLSVQSSNSLGIFKTGEDPCEASIQFHAPFVLSSVDQFDGGAHWTKMGNLIKVQLSDNTYVTGTWIDNNGCFKTCLDDVLHAEAYRFTNEWDYDYTDAGISNNSPLLSSTNGYRYGFSGVWRNQSSYLYQVDRKQGDPTTNIATDGTYKNFVLYSWGEYSTNAANNYGNPDWTFVDEQTRYSPFGFNIETRNALSIYSAALYGYNSSLSTAVGNNTTYFELASDGFEDYSNNIYPSAGTSGHGHLNLRWPTNLTPDLKTDKSHTGKVSMSLASPVSYNSIPVVAANSSNANIPQNQQTAYSFVAGKRYTISSWVYSPVSNTPQVNVTNGTNVVTSIMPQKIEGWQRVETSFTAPASGTVSITFQYINDNDGNRIDDIRIQPFQSGMQTYVYDPHTLWLVASLDDRNFATFYNYDEEGALVQVKAETEKGIFTVKTSRNNLQK